VGESVLQPQSQNLIRLFLGALLLLFLFAIGLGLCASAVVMLLGLGWLIGGDRAGAGYYCSGLGALAAFLLFWFMNGWVAGRIMVRLRLASQPWWITPVLVLGAMSAVFLTLSGFNVFALGVLAVPIVLMLLGQWLPVRHAAHLTSGSS
jgi:hypothetical protein